MPQTQELQKVISCLHMRSFQEKVKAGSKNKNFLNNNKKIKPEKTRRAVQKKNRLKKLKVLQNKNRRKMSEAE